MWNLIVVMEISDFLFPHKPRCTMKSICSCPKGFENLVENYCVHSLEELLWINSGWNI